MASQLKSRGRMGLSGPGDELRGKLKRARTAVLIRPREIATPLKVNSWAFSRWSVVFHLSMVFGSTRGLASRLDAAGHRALARPAESSARRTRTA